MLLCNKQEEARVQLNAEQADWKDDTDDESEEHELEAHYMYMAQIQEVTPDSVDNSGPIFDDEPMHKNVTVSSCSNSNIQEKTQLSRSRCKHSLKEIKSLFKFLSETLQDYGTMPIFKR
ncbi:hypothetical protein Tco_0347139, partial [Tanacetum coccineum]